MTPAAPAPALEIASSLGPNDLPYALPLHPNLVHFTIGLFAIAIAFDVAGALYPAEKRVFRWLALPVTRLARRQPRTAWWRFASTPVCRVTMASSGGSRSV